MGYALSARGIFSPAQKCRMYQSRTTFPQGAALGYGQQLGLQPAPIIYWAFVQIGSYKIHLFLTFSAALGIARTSSALHSLARKLAAARHSPSKLGLCARLAQTFVFNRPFTGRVDRLSYKHLFLRPPREARFEHHYQQDSFYYQQDNFSSHIREFLLQTL